MRPRPEAQRGSELPRRSRRATRARGVGVALGAFAVLWLAALPAAADEYDPLEAGHPARMLAYALHPVGVILDVLLLRPAHWIVSQPGLDEFFGHELYDD